MVHMNILKRELKGKKMATKKKVVKKKYSFDQFFKCSKCGLKTKLCEPCQKCGCCEFQVIREAVEIEEKEEK